MGEGQESDEYLITYTLTPGAKRCEVLVKRDLKALNSQSFIMFIFVLRMFSRSIS